MSIVTPLLAMVLFTLPGRVAGLFAAIVVANSFYYGARAGFSNIAGMATGIVILVAAVIIKPSHGALSPLDWMLISIRLICAAYLVGFGIKLWRGGDTTAPPGSGFSLGLLLILCNAGVLVSSFGFTMAWGLPPIALALPLFAILGIASAFVSGLAGARLPRENARHAEWIVGGVLIGSGIWLALIVPYASGN